MYCSAKFLTKKDVIDYVCEKLDSQGSRCLYYDACCYQSSGKKCAVGHLYSEEEMSKALIGNAIVYQSNFILPKSVEYLEDKFTLLQQLQRAHDTHWNPSTETFTECLKRIGVHYAS